MSTITRKTTLRSSTRIGARGSPSCSATVGRCQPTIGTRRCCSSSSTDIASSPTIGADTATNPGGLPKDVLEGLQAQLAASRAQFYYDLPAGPFYGYNRPGAKPAPGVIWNWWRQGMMGGAKAHYDGMVAFSQTDFTEDLKKITVPVS
jgi:non-heme chloroperoxidase